MSDGARDKDDQSVRRADEALSARLRHLGEGLERVGVGRSQEPRSVSRGGVDASAMSRGLRLSAELVGGVIVGAGLGWMLDYGLGTSPWGFIVLLLLGFAGGVLSVMRSSGAFPQNKA
jgi:ATP synthase protein I